jgi:hypothetical protein
VCVDGKYIIHKFTENRFNQSGEFHVYRWKCQWVISLSFKKNTNQGRFENVYHFPQFIQEPCGVKKWKKVWTYNKNWARPCKWIQFETHEKSDCHCKVPSWECHQRNKAWTFTGGAPDVILNNAVAIAEPVRLRFDCLFLVLESKRWSKCCASCRSLSLAHEEVYCCPTGWLPLRGLLLQWSGRGF